MPAAAPAPAWGAALQVCAGPLLCLSPMGAHVQLHVFPGTSNQAIVQCFLGHEAHLLQRQVLPSEQLRSRVPAARIPDGDAGALPGRGGHPDRAQDALRCPHLGLPLAEGLLPLLTDLYASSLLNTRVIRLMANHSTTGQIIFCR